MRVVSVNAFAILTISKKNESSVAQIPIRECLFIRLGGFIFSCLAHIGYNSVAYNCYDTTFEILIVLYLNSIDQYVASFLLQSKLRFQFILTKFE